MERHIFIYTYFIIYLYFFLFFFFYFFFFFFFFFFFLKKKKLIVFLFKKLFKKCSFLRILFIKQKKTVSFKNRNFTKISKCNLKFGSIGFFFFTFFRFEYYYINFLKKFLKFYFQIKYLNLKKFLF